MKWSPRWPGRHLSAAQQNRALGLQACDFGKNPGTGPENPQQTGQGRAPHLLAPSPAWGVPWCAHLHLRARSLGGKRGWCGWGAGGGAPSGAAWGREGFRDSRWRSVAASQGRDQGWPLCVPASGGQAPGSSLCRHCLLPARGQANPWSLSFPLWKWPTASHS